MKAKAPEEFQKELNVQLYNHNTVETMAGCMMMNNTFSAEVGAIRDGKYDYYLGLKQWGAGNK